MPVSDVVQQFESKAASGEPGDAVDRRAWLRRVGAAGLASLLQVSCGRRAPTTSPETPSLLRFPQKIPLRALNDRAPMLETPSQYFREDLTLNEAFYVRWHLEGIPTHVDLRTWRLRIDGHVERPLELSMSDLRHLEPVSLVAVNQCSGNSRSFFALRVPGGQWMNGAMGNALDRSPPARPAATGGLTSRHVQVSFQGLDEAPLPTVADFVKTLELDHARQPEVLVAYEMNGAPLPIINGFPVRLIVPGWYATYWVKCLSKITVLDHRFTGYWMTTAYLIPATPGANESPGRPPKT